MLIKHLEFFKNVYKKCWSCIKKMLNLYLKNVKPVLEKCIRYIPKMYNVYGKKVDIKNIRFQKMLIVYLKMLNMYIKNISDVYEKCWMCTKNREKLKKEKC